MALILCRAARATVINGFYQQHRAGHACTLYLVRHGGWAWGTRAGGFCVIGLGIYRDTGMVPVWVAPRIIVLAESVYPTVAVVLWVAATQVFRVLLG